MKCPNCGADIKDGSKFCEFCGSSITADMKREQEYVNKAGCPNCGSSNITFNREKPGEPAGKSCKDQQRGRAPGDGHAPVLLCFSDFSGKVCKRNGASCIKAEKPRAHPLTKRVEWE